MLKKITAHVDAYADHYGITAGDIHFIDEVFDFENNVLLHDSPYYVNDYGDDTVEQDKFVLSLEDINDTSEMDAIIKRNKEHSEAVHNKRMSLANQAKIDESVRFLKEQGIYRDQDKLTERGE